MISWLWNLIVGQFCRHQWEIAREVSLYDGPDASMPCGTKYHLCCIKCGEMKRRRL